MQLRPSLSRVSEVMLRSASKFDRRAPKAAVRAYEDVLTGLSFPVASGQRNREASDASAQGCRLARIRHVPTAVLTRATHERALIGHREPDSDCSHGFFRTIDGEIAIEALVADPHAAPGPPAYDLPPAAPHRRLARMPMSMGAPVIIILDELDPSSVRKRQRRRAVGGLSASGNSSRR